jgi:hypothetical protein
MGLEQTRIMVCSVLLIFTMSCVHRRSLAYRAHRPLVVILHRAAKLIVLVVSQPKVDFRLDPDNEIWLA